MVKWNKVVLELIELIKANKLCRLGWSEAKPN